MEEVKAIYRDNQFYREILRYMLSDSELKKIVEMSKYSEEEDKWNVQSFTLQEKSLALPIVKLGQIGNNRFTNDKNGGNKQIIFQNYGEDNNNNDGYDIIDDFDKEENSNNLQNNFELKSSKSSKKIKEINRYEDQINKRINFRMNKDRIYVNEKRQAKSQVPGIRNIAGTQKFFYNKLIAPSIDEVNNINKILMSKKEREKFEALHSGAIGNKKILNPMLVSASNSNELFPKANKTGKISLIPLGNINSNKIDNDLKIPPITGNKKIKLAHIGDK